MSEKSKQVLPGEKHFTSTVFLVTKEPPKRVLLMDHKKMKVWMPPGGHREIAENPYQTAIRETLEEAGIDISAYLPKPTRVDDVAMSLPVPNYIFEEKIPAFGSQPAHIHIDLIYVVKIPFQAPKNSERESESIGWFELKETKKLPLLDNVAYIISEILG